jgi:predicted nucleotidyltransferase
MIGRDKISGIVNKIASGYNPDKIILFGSYATGDPNEDSELDLFVI